MCAYCQLERGMPMPRKERYVLSCWDRLVFLALLALFAFASHVCESFSPVADSRHTKRLTRLGVVETEAPSNPVPYVGPFPSPDADLFESVPVFSRTVPRCESGESSPDETANNEREDLEASERSSTDGNGDNDYDTEGDSERSERLAKTAMAAGLLSRRRGVSKRSSVRQKETSVGPRRMGSASRARGRDSSVTKLVDAVRKGAAANTAAKPADSSKSSGETGENTSAKGLNLSRSAVQNTVQEMIGVLGNPLTIPPRGHQQNPPPRTLLLSPEQQTKPWNPADRVSVRVASETDDSEIANLRLSVFSNFSPDMRKAFVSRSCHVLSTRRNKGATCIAATVPRYGSILSQRPDIILGSAECSFHEFHGTTLGNRRLSDSVLYITEVAVSPTSRRKGIGLKLMQAIDQLAEMRQIETLFLHVDVNNSVALSLYERCGYGRVPSEDHVYYEFTKSLNLHDGATKGRNHFLMCKDLKAPTWLPADTMITEPQMSSIGFEIPR